MWWIRVSKFYTETGMEVRLSWKARKTAKGNKYIKMSALSLSCYAVTVFVVLGNSSKDYCPSSGLESTQILYCHIHNSQSLYPVFSQMNPDHILCLRYRMAQKLLDSRCLLVVSSVRWLLRHSVYLNSILPSTVRLFKCFFHSKFVRISHILMRAVCPVYSSSLISSSNEN